MNISKRAKALISGIVTMAMVISLVPAPALAEALEELELLPDEPLELVGDAQSIGVDAVGDQVDAEEAIAMVTVPGEEDAYYYASLPEALEAAPDGSTVTLLGDVKLSEVVTLTGKSLTLDIDDYALQIAKSKGLTVGSMATLTITGGEGLIEDNGNSLVNNILYANGGTINLNDVAAYTDYATILRVENAGKASIADSDLFLFSGSRSTIVSKDAGSEIVVNDGTDVAAYSSCAAKATDKGTLIVYGGTLRNMAPSSSTESAVEVRGSGSLLLNGGEVLCGDENYAGRAIEVNNGTAIIQNGTVVASCAVYASGLSADVDVTGGFLAGKISTWLYASVEVSGGWFSDQVADKYVVATMYASDNMADEAPDANYPYTVLDRTDIWDADVDVDVDFTYNGEAQYPEESDVTVELDDETLELGVDYVLDIPQDSINAGTYYVEVYGIGTYMGYAYGTYTIDPLDITDAEFEPVEAKVFDGDEATIGELEMTDPYFFTLVEDTDFVADYENNDAPGEATATVSGMGNFSGTLEDAITFTILTPDKDGLETLIEKVQDKLDVVEVSDDGFNQEPGTEYVPADQMEAINQALDSANMVYSDPDATQADIDDAIESLSQAYTTFVHAIKKAQKAVAMNDDTLKQYASLAAALSDAADGDTIDLLDTVEVANAIYVGGKNVTIDLSGKTLGIATNGGLTATEGATITIKNGDIEDWSDGASKLIVAKKGAVVLEDVDAYSYDATIVVAENGGSVTITDSTLYCSSNEKAAALATGADSSVHVSGETSQVTGEAIALRAVKDGSVVVLNGHIDAPEALCINGISSYGAVASGFVAGDLAIYNKGAIEVSGGWFTDKVPDNCVVVGMYATDALDDAPDANYPYTVTACTSIAEAIVTIEENVKTFTYNGEQQAPSPEDITVMLGENPLDPETDYVLDIETPSIDAGNYTVSVEGTGKYMGTASATFTIEPVDIAEADFEDIEDRVYNGIEETLDELTMTDPEFTLYAEVDFTAEYEDNDAIGTATATITGIGNFDGEATIQFDIVAPDKTDLQDLVDMVEVVETTSELYGYDLPVGTEFTSEEAKQAFEEALEAAQGVLDDDDATKDEVDAAAAAMAQAVVDYMGAIDTARLGVAANERLEMRYATLGDAVAEAEADDTVKLLDDSVSVRQVVIDKSITLDVNGKNFTNGSTLAALNIAGEGVEVVIDDLNEDDDVAEGRVWSAIDAAIEVVDGANLTIKGGRFMGATSVVNVDGGTLAVEDGSFSLFIDIAGLIAGKLLTANTDTFEDGDIVVTGGIFKNFDPSDNSGAGQHADFTLLGYTGVLLEGQNVWWTVGPQTPVAIPTGETLTYNGGEQAGVAEDDSETPLYTLEDHTATVVGDYEATATLVDAKNCIWQNAAEELVSGASAKIAWAIEAAPATDVTIEATTPLYAEDEPLSVETAIQSVKIGDNELPETDYEIQLVDADKPGTAKAILTGKDNLTGTTEVEFEILPAPDKGDLKRATGDAAKLLDRLDSATVYNDESEVPDPVDGLYVSADALDELNNAKRQADEVMADPQATPEEVKDATKRADTAVKDAKEAMRDVLHWERIWGQNGYDTMQAIVNTDDVFKPETTATVVIATRNNWEDPLAATALAGAFNAPLLLTGKATDDLPKQTREELERLQPGNVIVIGGTDVIGDKAFRTIKTASGGANVTRVSGKDYVARANEMFKYTDQWQANTAIVVTQNSFRDSLSVAPVAYAQKFPILFVGKRISKDEGGKLSDSTLALLKSKGIKHVIIVGGHLSVSTQVEDQLTGMRVERWFGQDSLDTSAEIAQNAIDDYGMSVEHVSVASGYGSNYVDALAGAALTGSLNSVLVLVNHSLSIGVGTKALDIIARRIKDNVHHGHVYGGDLSINGDYMEYINTIQ